MRDKRISLEHWIKGTKTKGSTAQGFPTKKVEEGNLHYWNPRDDNNSVAGFNALSVGRYLACGRDPSYRYSDIGVRVAKQRE